MAQLLFDLRAEMEDGTTYDVVADQRDIAKWEVQDFGTAFADIGSRQHMAYRWLAWSALTRRGLVDLEWPEFDALCVEATDRPEEEADVPADAEDPGRTAPSA
ncbi:hypothetical protein [Micromonospora endolithica]|uniref:Uncharacterized protein n=1 Tax=Micromonospora endolithica TaxID=230091 RepID=A0A3A9YQU2_9ACTN|nr:hypothetical protein [Micromonospora endolithica]RKN38451.1 hypothetical protein D7223_31085 [Micromonospora endolithica]TWJ23129.1 hypothetical protein JD76_03258 [Micromonospora endolithica]